MKLGFCLPQTRGADGDAIRAVATRAEQLGYDTLWVQERLLRPLRPQIPYPGTPDGVMPPLMASVLQPIETLVYAAAATHRIKLGTSVLVYAYRSPVSLAKSFASLDVLSGGRAVVGIGLGWNKEEYDISGTPFQQKGQRLEEYILCLKALWGPDPVEFQGEFYPVPLSEVGPKPVQKPHPPIIVGAHDLPALIRAGRLADGWFPVLWRPLEILAQGIQAVRSAAQQAGRDPASLQFPLRIFPRPTSEPLGNDRQPFTGTLAQMKGDVQKVAEIGVTELAFDADLLPDVRGPQDHLRYLEMLREVA